MHPELAQHLQLLLRPRTKLLITPAAAPPANTQLLSHMGGDPYSEQGESWPVNARTGQPLEFIFQLVNDGSLPMPFPAAVVQYFCDYHGEEVVFDSSDPALFAFKVYATADPARQLRLPRPAALPAPEYAIISFQPEQSLPDDDELPDLSPATWQLCQHLAGAGDWDELYNAAVTELLGEPDFGSWVGGYPLWLQGAYPQGEFFLEFDSEGPFMWGDSGLLYFFYQADQDQPVSFELQCC